MTTRVLSAIGVYEKVEFEDDEHDGRYSNLGIHHEGLITLLADITAFLKQQDPVFIASIEIGIDWGTDNWRAQLMTDVPKSIQQGDETGLEEGSYEDADYTRRILLVVHD